MKYLLGLILGVIILFAACTKDREVIKQVPPPPVTAQCDTATINYSNYVKGIIDANCATAGCHNAGSGIGDFTTYAGLKPKVDNGAFKARAIDGTPSFMPPSNPLPQSTRDSLNDWLNQGACEN